MTMLYTFGCNKPASAARHMHRHDLAAMLERNLHREGGCGVKSAPIRAGLVRVDQVGAHPHNVRRDLGDIRDRGESLIRLGMLQRALDSRYVLR